ncbi:UDP-glucuronosyl/UDP-glucosyltransferase [Dillenia turbinata]|uniref:Glycosyltransferase n=1 Tax=Dillenia turbinata TaxID=194707 RepID=A0AAN8ZA51_9MAGN
MAHPEPHFLLVTFPAQGHINPAIQFAKRLIRSGSTVSFATSVSARRRMTMLPNPKGLSFVAFSDGYDDGFKADVHDPRLFMSDMKRLGSQTLRELILSIANEGRPVTCLIYTLLLPWAADVARDLHVPSALLWIQPATVLDTYYYYFNGYEDAIRYTSKDNSSFVQLPGLPPFTARDLPSFMVDSNAYSFVLPTFQEQLEAICKEENPSVLVNTFDELEPEALKAIDRFKLIAVGPLMPSAFIEDGTDPSDTCFGGDLFQKPNDDYVDWLNSHDISSVIYVSFGSISVLSKKQMEEIAKGLLESDRPFLWVIRSKEDGQEEDTESITNDVQPKGKIVQWCSQVEVLKHPSVGCFLTHCGWNSSLESLVSGVPVVAFPQWTDQGTNAKLIEDVWRTGVRVSVNDEGIVEGNEIKRCLDLVMGGGESGIEFRLNAKKWKDLARQAVRPGGSSYINLNAFVDEVKQGCH